MFIFYNLNENGLLKTLAVTRDTYLYSHETRSQDLLD